MLHGCVCRECNDYFGRTLDRALTRESLEGFERYKWGTKASHEVDNFQWSSVSFAAKDVGEYSGVPVRIMADQDGKLRAAPKVCVAIADTTGEHFHFFTEQELANGAWKQASTNWRKGVKVFGSESDSARLRQLLHTQGILLRDWRPLEAPPADELEQVELEVDFRITPEMKRGIAKIAMNYLAHRVGSDAVQAPAFDAIRRFVRHGEEPRIPPIHTDARDPFPTGRTDGMRPVIHWVELTTHSSQNNLLAKVSLYGLFTHTVILAEKFVGPWPPLPTAHLYNPKMATVLEIIPALRLK